MTINRLPLSTERLTFHLVQIEPKSDFESGEQRKTPDGVPQWKATVLVTSDELKAETCEVTIAAATMPSFPAGITPVKLEAPMASLWQQGTRAGLAISAKSIRPASTRPSAPSPNGTPEPVAAKS